MVECNCKACVFNVECLGKNTCINKDLKLNRNGFCQSKVFNIFKHPIK